MFPDIELKEGWATVVLLMLLFLCVAWAMQSAHWTDGLSILQGVVLVGGGLGIILAKSRVPNRMAHLLSVLAGFTWSIYLIGRLLAQTVRLPVSASIVALDWRIQSWVTTLISRGTGTDNYIFILTMCLLLWAMAYVSAWAIFRWQRAWWAVIICGMALMLNNIYSTASLNGYLIAFLFFGLLLIVRTNVAFHEQEWRVARVAYNSELVLSFLRAGLVISILAILLAWVTPKALASRPFEQMWIKLGEPWRRFQDQSARAFGNLNYQSPQTYIYSDRGVRFGGPVTLGDTPIIDVQSPAGRYWRVMVYHEYTSTGWNNTDTDTVLVDGNEQLLAVPQFDLRREFTQTITLRQDLGPDGIIAAASQPLRSPLPLRAVVSLVTSGDALARSPDEAEPRYALPGDPSVLYSREALKAGESYQVYSSLSEADAESLRDASTRYPDWVVPRYFQLPDSLPERVRLLAQEITQGENTAYDKAVAIERYLRNFPYNDQIAGPKVGQDGVDYFLFDAKQGYCDYYASAMVVMLRSVGVPARYVRGYSQGERGDDGVYHVREWDGHAWPEVFFTGYGWVEFEPTAGEPVLSRPSSRADAEENAVSDMERFRRLEGGPIPDYELEPEPSGQAFEVAPTPLLQRLGRGFWLSLDLLAMLLVLAALFRVRRKRHVAGLTVAERVFEDLVEWVRRLLHIELLAHQTPYEYAEEVAEVVPRATRAMEQIADSYARERFGKVEISEVDTEAAWHQSWRALWLRWGEQRTEPVRRFGRWLVPPKGTYSLDDE
jgi:transglutaminase-like putative cysteine protease